MDLRAVVIITTAPAGSGKSYLRAARFLINEFLPEREGVHWSNFPLGEVPEHHTTPPEFSGETFADRIARRVAANTRRPVSEFSDRVRIIPDHELSMWREGRSGPWEFFEHVDIANAHIAIDEVHNYCSPKQAKPIRLQWQKWLGEIRHRGATAELISQHENKIATELIDEAGAKLSIVNCEDERDPYFGITCADWYEVRAKYLTGEYRAAMKIVEKRDVDGKWKPNTCIKYQRDPDYFQFYDSFSSPNSGQGVGVKAPDKAWQRYGRMRFALWFINRNAYRLASRLAVVVLGTWVCFGGGGKLAIETFIEKFNQLSSAQMQKQSNTQAPGVQMTTPADTHAQTKPDNRPTDLEEARAIQQQATKPVTQPSQQQTTRQTSTVQNDPFALVLLTNDACVLRNGMSLTVGDVIDGGPKDGKRIQSIDFRRRLVRLEDGSTIRMGVYVPSAIDRLRQVPGVDQPSIHIAPPDSVDSAVR